MNKRLLAFVVTLALGLLPLLSGEGRGEVAQDQKIDLKLSLTQGQTFRMLVKTSASPNWVEKGHIQSGSETSSIGLVFTVREVAEDGSAQLKATFEKPTYRFSGPDEAHVAPLTSAVNALLSGLDGQSFEFELSPRGAVRSLSGLTAAAAAAAKRIEHEKEPLRSIVTSHFNQMMSDSVWKQSLEMLFALLPSGPVAIGERWSKSVSMSAPGISEQSELFAKIVERSSGVCKLKVYQQIKSSEKTLALGVRYSLAGIAEGTVDVEEATGLITRGSMVARLKGKGSAVGGRTSSPISVTATFEVERH